MLDLINKVLGKTVTTKTTDNNDSHRAHIALCVLLLEAAHVDGKCSNDEKKQLITTMITECGVPREEIDTLIASANQKRKESVDLFSFTRYMNNTFTKKERIAVMDSVWRIIHIDGHLEAHEDHFAHKLANLLRLTHKELIDSKIKAREQLKVS